VETARQRRSLGRLSEIARVAGRHGFGYVFDRQRTPADMHVADRGRRLREMLDELGPTFVKFGQLLSTRPDVVPPDIVAELRKLQDDVSPVSFPQIRQAVEAELELTLERAFLSFDEEPIAAASIGQVHRASLPNGEDVVVKVQRPNAPRQIESDLQLLRSAVHIARERVRALDFIDAEALVDEGLSRVGVRFGGEVERAAVVHDSGALIIDALEKSLDGGTLQLEALSNRRHDDRERARGLFELGEQPGGVLGSDRLLETRQGRHVEQGHQVRGPALQL